MLEKIDYIQQKAAQQQQKQSEMLKFASLAKNDSSTTDELFKKNAAQVLDGYFDFLEGV